eukprot:CAMPEP_0117426288 /NCGR_PEP_ID=MMETSP0758-20121206/6448_1 /TAXON_ID=63605 /ORGANISM="Percolomonas cosmopolitus, Strain AE-1 (ATCC 50343)" /LENGTH=234 /DNA_ID=CAMNT_0005211399 /DNA_START=8 /DNA_END=712 /DNA_ORIENTATION=-
MARKNKKSKKERRQELDEEIALKKEKGVLGKIDEEEDEENQENTKEEENEENTKENVTLEKRDMLDIVFCPHCKFPQEYCEFSPFFLKKCLPEIEESDPKFAVKLKELHENDDKKKKKVTLNKPKTNVDEETGVALDGSEVIISIKKRKQRKFNTIIEGLDKYDQVLKKAAKSLQKELACGCSAIKKPLPAVEIQGDYRHEMLDVIQKLFHVPDTHIYILDPDSQKKRLLKNYM